MNTIWIVCLEPIDQRYTKQWYDNIPAILKTRIAERELDYNVVTIEGQAIAENTTPGAFLDFGATNVYKSSQAMAVSQAFSDGLIKPGDKFLITDAWNFIITPIKYMSDLLDIPVEIHSIWHAGAYDPSDILGYKMSKPWPWLQEQSWFMCSDYNYYATESHKNMFLTNLDIPADHRNRAVRSGQPHELIVDNLCKRQTNKKTDTVLWPHRYNDDKQPEIAELLAEDFDMIITQKMSLEKEAYYDTMSTCKVIFSCALHENLGISVMEAVLTGAIPVLPDRCSYSEMYLPEFKYPSEWTESVEQYKIHATDLKEFIQDKLDNYDQYKELIKQQQERLVSDYLNCDIMIDCLLEKSECNQ